MRTHHFACIFLGFIFTTIFVGLKTFIDFPWVVGGFKGCGIWAGLFGADFTGATTTINLTSCKKGPGLLYLGLSPHPVTVTTRIVTF